MTYKRYLKKSSYLFVCKKCAWTKKVYYKSSHRYLWMCSGGLTKGSKIYSVINFFIIDIPANKRQIYNRINILNWFVQFNNFFCDVCTVIRIKKVYAMVVFNEIIIVNFSRPFGLKILSFRFFQSVEFCAFVSKQKTILTQ